MTIEPVEFDCVDCGRHIVSWMTPAHFPLPPAVRVRPKDGRCSVCAWVIENISPEEHDVVRERLGVPMREIGS